MSPLRVKSGRFTVDLASFFPLPSRIILVLVEIGSLTLFWWLSRVNADSIETVVS
jgi:hypothetical protein